MVEINQEIDALNERIRKEAELVQRVIEEIRKVIVGQQSLIEKLLVGLLANGHVLLEGVPGLAKTMTVETLSRVISGQFRRIQFIPDLLPADLIGTSIYRPQDGTFVVKKGPIFANIILADEINRAPAKVQSALLEAMQEKQVSIGEETFRLEEPFLVLATQNPIEQEGTYPLPEAQLDRFMLKVKVGYPSKVEEREIMERMAVTEVEKNINPVMSLEDVMRLRKLVDDIYMDSKIKEYIVDIVFATRQPEEYGISLKNYIEYGASPRASICLALASKAHAFIQGRGYVTPFDVKSIGMDVLRHRVITSYEAEAEEMDADDVIKKIFDEVPVP
jgi:MoxR-like ATPase